MGWHFKLKSLGIASFESAKYSSTLEIFIILIVDISYVTIHIFKLYLFVSQTRKLLTKYMFVKNFCIIFHFEMQKKKDK